MSSLHLTDYQSAEIINPDDAAKVTTSVEAKQKKPMKPVSLTKNENGSMVVKTVEPVKKPSQQSTAESEEALAKAFHELYPADSTKTTIPDASLPMSETQPALTFMTPSDRQQALSELIQNLQLTYVTRAGN